MAKVIFIFNGIKTMIECLKGDKMGNICSKFASKIDIDMNLLNFLYESNKVNLNLSFEQQANSNDKDRNEMNILVYKLEKEEYAYPKCGENIDLDKKLIENICLSNNNINNNLIGIKSQIENIINTILNKKEIDNANDQLKSIIIMINIAIGEINKINDKLRQLKNTYQNNVIMKNLKCNVIEGILNIKTDDLYNGVILFNKKNKEGIDVYLNNTKINLIKEENECKMDYHFKEEGKYKFKIIFNNKITSFHRFFQNCSSLYSIDLSNFESRNIVDTSYMFNLCNNLKKINGLNKFNTSNVNNMRAMFQGCTELENLDLSNFDTSIVKDMSYMFNRCNKLKEIKGINKFITNRVTNMSTMFRLCNELEYLDLSNFETKYVADMKFMFDNCNKLKEIKGINKFDTSSVENMKAMFQQCYTLEYLDLSNFDTSNVSDMSYMFNTCYRLKEIKGINKFNTSNVNNMSTMFQCCSLLEHLDLSNFETYNTSDMSYMFHGCNSLKYLNVSKFELKDATFRMFFFGRNDELQFIAEDKKMKTIFDDTTKFLKNPF